MGSSERCHDRLRSINKATRANLNIFLAGQGNNRVRSMQKKRKPTTEHQRTASGCMFGSATFKACTQEKLHDHNKYLNGCSLQLKKAWCRHGHCTLTLNSRSLDNLPATMLLFVTGVYL